MTSEFAFGVDIGGSNVRTVLGDNKGNILRRVSEKTDVASDNEGISKQIIRMIRSIQPENSLMDSIKGIGVGSAGPLDLKKGGLMKPTNMPYDFVPIVEPLKKEFRIPVFLLNDCVMGVIGEKYFGAGTNLENLVYVTLSTGIGAGVYVDDNLLVGKDGNAAEVGHLTIDSSGYLTCFCGKPGHWEGYCSGRGIPRYLKALAKEMSPEIIEKSLLNDSLIDEEKRITAKNVFEAAKKGDQLSKIVIERIGALNGIGFACIVDAYDPDIITVGGSVALNNPNLILEPIKNNISQHAINRLPRIMITPLEEDVVLYGALAVALFELR